MTTLDGQVAVITGASRGIGLAIADLFHDEGAHVVRLSRSLRPRATARRTDIPCDLTKKAELSAAIERMIEVSGAPDIVVNNAGSFVWKPLADTTIEDFEQQLAINLVAPFRVVRTLLPHLLAKTRAHVVTIGSIADHRPLPGNVAYGASKYGVRGMHAILAAELADSPVRMTLISPGPTNTPLWDPHDPDARDDLPDRSRMIPAADVALAALFAVTRAPSTNVELIRLMPA